MPECGLNLPCTQTVPMESDISALQITNSGEQGRAIEGANTQSSDAAVLGTNTAAGGIGVKGVGTGLATELSPAGIGVFGQSNFAAGVQGQCGSTDPYLGPEGPAGVIGVFSPIDSTITGDGVVGVCNGPSTSGLYGNGVVGVSTAANGVTGTSSLNFTSGVLGVAGILPGSGPGSVESFRVKRRAARMCEAAHTYKKSRRQ